MKTRNFLCSFPWLSKAMFSFQHHQSEFFEIKYFIGVYGYDPNTRNCKVPFYELFIQKFIMINPSQKTVGDIINDLMNLKPAVFFGVKDSPDKYRFHLVLPPVAYPCHKSCWSCKPLQKRQSIIKLHNYHCKYSGEKSGCLERKTSV